MIDHHVIATLESSSPRARHNAVVAARVVSTGSTAFVPDRGRGVARLCRHRVGGRRCVNRTRPPSLRAGRRALRVEHIRRERTHGGAPVAKLEAGRHGSPVDIRRGRFRLRANCFFQARGQAVKRARRNACASQA